MGEVYRARDLKLGRDVAIKVLPEAVAREQDRLARLEREGRTLAALNHPNIANIYGLEDTGAIRALVMELVEGPTLADRIARWPVPPAEAVSIARQIVDALDAAHERGIVHRDLKPANVKITPEGVVKVLDFGLAKGADEMARPDLTQSPTITSVNTRDGVILGTAAYMSPEQARGSMVDKRTDIWAFGCVLYEMLVGRSAFGRDTLSDTLVSILDREPDWTALPPGTPTAVRTLMRRCLEKDQKRRLRDIGDARPDLDAPIAETESPGALAPRHLPLLPWSVTAAALVALAAMSWAWWSGREPDTSGAPTFSRIVPITNGPAREFGPVISPDGKWVAYISNAGGSPNVWVKFLAGGEPVNLTASAGLDVSGSAAIGGLEVSPDGSRIAVAARLHGTGSFSTYEIPAPLPGPPRALFEEGFQAQGMRWSPDGKRMAFIRPGGTAGDAIWVADGDGTNRRELVKASGGAHMHWVSWSPDGFIYYMRPATTGFNLDQTEIYRVAASGGSPERVVATLTRAMFPVPLPGGLIYSSDSTSVDLGIWWRPFRGIARWLTFGLGEYAEPRVSADGRVLVATRYENRRALARIETSGPQVGRITPLTDGFGGDLDPTWVPTSNRIAFSSTRDGARHLWTANIDGTDLRPLTSGASQDERPALSPDGQTVAFVAVRGGERGIWLIAAAGGPPRKLVNVSPVSGLSWSRDGTAVIYAGSAGTWPGLWSVSVADGQTRQIVAPGAVGEPQWSPTSDRIAYLEAPTGQGVVGLSFIAPDGDPQSAKSLKAPPAMLGGFTNGMMTWSPDGKRLAVTAQAANGPTSIWVVDPDAAVPFQKLVELPLGPRIRGLTWTTDGALIVGQYDSTSDIVLMDQGATVAAGR
jgi:serine/threonine protein kinase